MLTTLRRTGWRSLRIKEVWEIGKLSRQSLSPVAFGRRNGLHGETRLSGEFSPLESSYTVEGLFDPVPAA
jgi:hypothetical protein